MSRQPFDDFAKLLVGGASRRTVLKGLAMAIGGAAVALLAGGSSEAAPPNLCRQPGQSCNKHNECCSGICVPKKNGHGNICG